MTISVQIRVSVCFLGSELCCLLSDLLLKREGRDAISAT